MVFKNNINADKTDKQAIPLDLISHDKRKRLETYPYNSPIQYNSPIRLTFT